MGIGDRGQGRKVGAEGVWYVRKRKLGKIGI